MSKRWLSFLSHAARHPYALLPGTPDGIINSAHDWVGHRQRSTPADIRRGPAAAVWEIVPAGVHCNPAPRCVDEGVAPACLRLFPTPAASLFFLRGARVLGSDGVVISPDNRVFAEFTYADDAGGIESHSVFRRRRIPAPRPLRGAYATLCYPSSTAYAHWMAESLPRLRLLEPHLAALDGIFVPDGLPASMRESLTAFGVRPDQVVPLAIASHVAPEHLYVPAYCAGLDIAPWVPTYLRSRVLGDAAATSPTRRLYVSRRKVGRRRILNEDDVVRVLARRGFETVHPEELGFAEQARLFSEARVVVGASGAALFNALFCAPGGSLIEIPPHVSLGCHYYHSIASVAGLDYWVVPGSAPAQAPRDGTLDHVDFQADIEALDRTLGAVLASGTE